MLIQFSAIHTDNSAARGDIIMSYKVIILAAGFGSRLMPYTADRPKCMVSLCGKSILQRQIDIFHKHGIEQIAVVAGHQAQAVDHPDITEKFINEDYNSTNMVASLMCARDWIESGSDIIVSYGDIVFNQQVIEKLIGSKEGINVVIDQYWRKYWSLRMEDPLSDAETMKFKSSGYIQELGKKPRSYDDVQGQYIGLQLWRTSAIKRILGTYDAMDREKLYDGNPFPKMFMTSFIQHLIDEGNDISPVIVKNGWLEIDTVQDLESYEYMEISGKLREFYNAA